MQDSAPLTACELGAVLGRRGKEADPHGVSSTLWTHLAREARLEDDPEPEKGCDGGPLERSEPLARRKVSFLLRKGDTDLHASVEQKRCNRRVCDRARLRKSSVDTVLSALSPRLSDSQLDVRTVNYLFTVISHK